MAFSTIGRGVVDSWARTGRVDARMTVAVMTVAVMTVAVMTVAVMIVAVMAEYR